MSEQATIATIEVGTELAFEQGFFVCGRSPAMRMLEGIAREIATTGIPVLIVGESGTGKQVIARLIHEASSQRGNTMLRLVCGTLTPETVSNQIRLHEPKPATGTVILDEIGDLDRESQRKLLHVLPDGDSAPTRETLTARVISTTSQNIEHEVRAGRFRNDLFHRLNGVCLRIAPLRERPEDIAPLVEFFVAKHAARFGKNPPVLSPAAMLRLTSHSWSGNVRELENISMKIVALADEQIALADLSGTPTPVPGEKYSGPVHSLKAAARAASREAERELILRALARTRWNRKRAAQELQISYKSLLYKIKQIGLPNSGID